MSEQMRTKTATINQVMMQKPLNWRKRTVEVQSGACMSTRNGDSK